MPPEASLATADRPPDGLLAAGLAPPSGQGAETELPNPTLTGFNAAPPQSSPDASTAPPAQKSDPMPSLDRWVQRNMELEGYGLDPHTKNVVSGFTAEEWLELTRGDPQVSGKSNAEILQMRYDNTPEGQAYRSRQMAKEGIKVAGVLARAGLPVNAGTTRLGVWAGPAGAVNVLRADPNTPLEQLAAEGKIHPKTLEQNPTLRGLTAGQWVQMTDQQMKGGDPFAQRQAGVNMSDEIRANSEKAIKAFEADRTRYLADAEKAPEGSAERMQMLREAHDASRKATEEFERMSKIPPVYRPVDAFAGFGGIIMALAAFAGRRSAQPLTASINAMSGALDAMNKGNHEDYKRNMAVWEKQTDYALKLVGIQNNEIRNILEDQRLAEAEKQAKLMSTYRLFEMDKAVEAANRGDMQALWQMQHQSQLLAEQAKYHQEHIDYLNKSLTQRGTQAGAAKEIQIVDQEGKVIQSLSANPSKTPGVWYDSTTGQQIQVPEGARIKIGNQFELTPEAAEFNADLYLKGDTSIITSLPRTGPARIQVENKIAEKTRGMDDASAQLMMNRMRMAEAKSAATTAGRVTMNTELYAQEAAGAGKEVVTTSKKFDRTNFPKINQALAAYETHTGDPDVIRFGAAINALINAYGKMSNPTGTGIHDADKERLAKILDTSLSQGQVEAAVDQIVREGRVVSGAAQRAQEEVLRGIVPGAKEAVSGGVPVPAEHSGDADGTTYKGSDGTTYVKRGHQMVPQ